MGWMGVTDSFSVDSGDSIRCNYDALCFGSIDAGDRRATIEKYAPVEVTALNDLPGWLSIEAKTTRKATAGEIRNGIEQAFAELRDRWTVTCAWSRVTSIQVDDGSIIPEIPASTAVSLASIAIIAIAGYILYSQLRVDLD